MTALDQLCVNTIRGLAIDAIQKANSGHPGLPMGMADVAYVLWTRFLKYDPARPDWQDRDRLVLSGGHGSMLLYGLLHLSGVDLTLDEIKGFRQLHSRTTGHPEVGEVAMVETTTGPLGQGFANAVGMAMAERMLRERFGAELCDHRTWVLCGDGDVMEGICYEAASLAGHLGLGRLIALYDDNSITIDGSTALAFTEDRVARFEALGWHVQVVDGHDHGQIAEAIEAAQADPRPSVVCCRTIIGRGSPNKAGTSKVHGSPLGVEEVRLTKQQLGLDPDVDFAVPAEVLAQFRARDGERAALCAAWDARLAASPRAAEWAAWQSRDASAWLDQVHWPAYEVGKGVATRKAGSKAIEAVAAAVPNLVGGSADLACSNLTYQPQGGDVMPTDFRARNIHFGIREHAMASICSGIALHGGLRPYCGTFLVFHDYMRPAVRLAAFMKLPVIYVYTHDSIFVGEDGPTHQPIEHLMALRTIPGLVTLRPADGPETSEAWRVAMARTDGPTALALTRQNLPTLDRSRYAPAAGIAQGGYVLREASAVPRVVLIASGSEVELALSAADTLESRGVPTRVVNLASWELFDAQPVAYRRAVLPAGIPRVSVEAGLTRGWERYVGLDGASVGIDRFGLSAPGEQVAQELGLTAEHVVGAALGLL
ncbi:MAG: transketolase [Pseudomonadota bacterium]